MTLGNTYNLNIDTSKIPLLSNANTFTATQNFVGNPGITVNNSSSDGIDVTKAMELQSTVKITPAPASMASATGLTAVSLRQAAPAPTEVAPTPSPTPAFTTGAAGWEYGSTQENIGVWGFAASGIGVAAYDEAYTSSAQGRVCCGGLYPIGVWADTAGNTSASSPGIGALTTVDTGWSLVSYNNSTYPTAFIENEEATSSSSTVLETVGGNFGGVCTIDVSGNLFCSGSKSAVVPVDGGSKKVAMYAIEGPENWFEDAGSGQLSNGSAVIRP